MKKQSKIIIGIFLLVGAMVFFASLLMLILGNRLDENFNMIGIRLATLFVAFSSFLSSMLFSLLILMHNKTVVKYSEDANKRAELFREQQFISANYSIIEFTDKMHIYDESTRYIDRLIERKSGLYHMAKASLSIDDVFANIDNYRFFSLKLPFRIAEGKTVSSITFNRLKFERSGKTYEFFPPENQKESFTYLLYDEDLKRNNVIINLIVDKESQFFKTRKINEFSKFKMNINMTSILGILIKVNSELFFSNPEQIEIDGSNTYKINSSSFTMTEMPSIIKNPQINL